MWANTVPELLSRLVAARSRPGGKTAHFLIDVTCYSDDCYPEKHHTTPAKYHQNP